MLFLMNHRQGTREVADSLLKRLAIDAGSELREQLDAIYLHVLHRSPSDERTLADRFVERRRRSSNTPPNTPPSGDEILANSSRCCCAGTGCFTWNEWREELTFQTPTFSRSHRRFAGIVATGSLWAGDGALPAAASSLHHPGKVKSVIFYYCKGGPCIGHTFDKPRRMADPSLIRSRFAAVDDPGWRSAICFRTCNRRPTNFA